MAQNARKIEEPAADNVVNEAPAVEFKPITFGRKMAANRLFADNRVIRLHPEIRAEDGTLKVNVKRGKAATRFALFRDGMTVGEYIAACVDKGDKTSVATADLLYDTDKGFIVIE
jgi:hypothetical protein